MVSCTDLMSSEESVNQETLSDERRGWVGGPIEFKKKHVFGLLHLPLKKTDLFFQLMSTLLSS